MSTIGLTKNRGSWSASPFSGLVSSGSLTWRFHQECLENNFCTCSCQKMACWECCLYSNTVLENFLENSHNNKMSYKYLHSHLDLYLPQLFSCAQGFWSTPSLSNSIGYLSPLSFASLSFSWTYLLVFSLSIVHILSSKISSKTAPGV